MAKKPIKTNSRNKQSKISGWDHVTRFPLAYLIFFVIAFLIYGQTLQFFLGKFDEDLLILGNLDFLKDLSNIKTAFIKDAFLSDKGASFYRPLQTVSYMIDAQFFFVRGSVFYFTNILIHAAACSALFYLLSMLGNNRKAAFILTFLFLASPLFVHAIAWAPSRGDLLIGLTGILSMIFFIKMTTTRQYKYSLFTFIAFTAAMFSKETAILIPFVIILYCLYIPKKQNLPLPLILITLGGFLLTILLYFFLRSHVVKFSSPAAEFGLIPFIHNLRTFPEYMAKFLIPVYLSPMSGFTVTNTVLGLFLFAILIVIAFRFSSRPYTKVLFGISWFLVFSIPGVMYSHTIGSAAYDYLEHRSYLPMAGIILVFFFIYNDISEGKLKDQLAHYTMLFAVILGIYSFFYTKNYENPMIFYNHTIVSNPASAMALNNRGLIKAEIKDPQGAIADYDKALAIKHDFAKAWVNKGITLMELNDNAGAILQFDTAIKYEPDLFQAHFNKAIAKSNLGFYDEAIREYTISIKLYPSFVPGYMARGLTYFRLNDYSAAENDYSTAIKLDDKNASAYLNRGKSRFNGTEKKGACADWQKASDLGDSEARDLLFKVCKQ